MRILDKTFKFSFKPLRYKSRKRTKKGDRYDSNWLVVRFSFVYEGKKVVIDQPELTNFEVIDFVKKVRSNTTGSFDIALDNLAPHLCLRMVQSIYDGYHLNVSYAFELDGKKQKINFVRDLTREEVDKFLNSLEKEFSKFAYISSDIGNDDKNIAESEWHDGIVQHRAYPSFEYLAHEIEKLKGLSNKVFYTDESITINFHEGFIVNLIKNDNYKVYINDRYAGDVEEKNSYDYINRLNSLSFIQVEFVEAENIFESVPVLSFEENTAADKNVVRIFNSQKTLYVNNRALTRVRKALAK